MKSNFNPNQPRVPAGSPDGGRWVGDTASGTGANHDQLSRQRLAQITNDPFAGALIDLRIEETRGGHTIARHVNRSPQWLINRIVESQVRGLFVTTGLKRAGSFPSLAAANRLVRSTISQNRAIVESVARGESKGKLLFGYFSSKTGIEAYIRNSDRPFFSFRRKPMRPILRDTYGVGVWIVHDPSVPKGYVVVTAYPRDD